MKQKNGTAALLELQGVCKFYTGASVVMGLNGINLTFDSGEFVAITGESGSGKSTLAHILGGILPYENGEMMLRGQPTSHFDGADWERYRRENISFISQSYGILAGATVLSNVVSALRLAGMDKKTAKERAEELLKLVELWDLRQRRAGRLSSGQKQRLSIARALAKPAPILIADEPTGNLDPENSAKIINLLAKAAQERLVILITHDFQEAQDHVTRKIQLQDGKVVLDTPLRERCPVTHTPAVEREKPRPLSHYIAALQLGARPVWTTLVLLFSALTAFAVFAFLGTFMINLDDTSTRIYDKSAFYNGDKTRIVVQRGDVQPMTQEDLETIVSVPYAAALERYGYVTDVNYAYRQDVDYKVHYNIRREGEATLVNVESVELLDNMDFIKTVPMLPAGQEFLTAGRLPENVNEVVLCGSEDRIGEKISVYLQDVKTWNISSYLELEVEIVGVTDYGDGLYFSDELGRVFTNFMMSGGKFSETDMIFPDHSDNWSLEDDQCVVSQSRLNWYHSIQHYYKEIQESIPLWVRNSNKYLRITEENAEQASEDPDAYERFEVVHAHSISYADLVLLAPATFDRLAWAGNSSQVTLYIQDYAYTQQVLERLEELGYTALSPFAQCSTEKDPTLAAERVQTLGVCLGAMIAVGVLLVLVLRELFGIQKESFKLLADQGLGRKTARNALIWQVLFFTVLGQLLGFGGIIASGTLGVERIEQILRYLRAGQWISLSATHLALTLVGLLFVVRMIRKAVFPAGGNDTDLKLEEVAG